MSCRLDVKDAILDNIMDKFVTGRNTFERIGKDVVAIIGGLDNRLSKAKKASQARAIAESLARRVSEYTDKHVMGWINRTDEYSPFTVTFAVSPSYIESEYRKLPKEKQTDPADKELPEAYRKIIDENKGKMDPMSRMMIEGSPIEFLKYIAEQSYGVSPREDGTYAIIADEKNPPQYGVKEILNIAQEMFPKSDYIKPMNLPPIEPEC